MRPISARTACVLALLAGMLVSTLGATPSPNDALGRWLPNVVPKFVPWGLEKASYGGKYDSFRCGGGSPIATNTREFDFAIGTCHALQNGTALNYGSGEPQRGRVLYDPAHRIALYYVGCCAGRTYVLAADVAPPPSSVRSADLSGVGTARGASLGMTIGDVMRAYGKAVPYMAGSAGSVVPVISYTTFSSNPVQSSEPCGQYQTFAFKSKKVNVIQIYAGC